MIVAIRTDSKRDRRERKERMNERKKKERITGFLSLEFIYIFKKLYILYFMNICD
jgi:hypothetical protein